MFNPVEVIRKKRDGISLGEEEIRLFVRGITDGSVPDYQVSAFAMAVFFRGMEEGELFRFCKAMVESGDVLTLPGSGKGYVDKHSTGGVGDKLTLILAPLAAACGLKMPKMSGRGLGFSGGTVDKLESIPGFRTALSRDDLLRQTEAIGLGLIGQSEGMAGADKKLYAIRDVTATVESIPLIASSIVSKKIASGARNIVFDVKVGRGAFMKDVERAEELGRTLVRLVKAFGGRSVAVVTDMDAPLGHYVGNALEIREVAETLKGRGPDDIVELVEELGSRLLMIGGIAADAGEGRRLIRDKMADGEGLLKFAELIRSQGGDPLVLEDYTRLPVSRFALEVVAEEGGILQSVDAEAVGRLSVLLGAGRLRKDDSIDYGAGLYLAVKAGATVRQGDLLCRLHYDRTDLDLEDLKKEARKAFALGTALPAPRSLVLKVIGDGEEAVDRE